MVLKNGRLSHIGNPKECAYHYYEMINAMRVDQKKKIMKFQDLPHNLIQNTDLGDVH